MTAMREPQPVPRTYNARTFGKAWKQLARDPDIFRQSGPDLPDRYEHGDALLTIVRWRWTPPYYSGEGTLTVWLR
jgi:hypothetical protein